MIIATIILGSMALLGGGLLARYMNNLLDWLKRAITKVNEMVHMMVYGTKVFIKRVREGIEEISKHYSQDNTKRWHETVVTRTVDENEVPKEFLNLARHNAETDITDRVERQLQLA